MSEARPLRDYISDAIDQCLADNGGGFRLAFSFAVDVVDDEGGSAVVFGEADQQPTYRSIGLTHYMAERYAMIARSLLSSSAPSCDDDCDCGEDD